MTPDSHVQLLPPPLRSAGCSANHALQNGSVRHGTCFRRRLSAHHAATAPPSAVAELGVVRRSRTSPMNRRQALAGITLLLFAHALAEEPKENTDYKTYIFGLAPCDRIEVIRIGDPAGELVPIEGRTDGGQRLKLPDDKSKLYHVEPYDEWWTVHSRTTIKGPDAERIATLYRALKPRENPVRGEDGRMSYISGPNCHAPPFAYRFYSGDKLLYDTSICWGCQNIIVGPDGKRHYFYFQTKTKEAVQLFEESNKLFPDHPAK